MISFSMTVVWFSNVDFVDDNVMVQRKRLCRPGGFQEPGEWEGRPGVFWQPGVLWVSH